MRNREGSDIRSSDTTTGAKAFLTIKGKGGLVRAEFEYQIPLVTAEALLQMCAPNLIEKTRHEVEYEGMIWAVDEFSGRHAGLVLAEIEPTQKVHLPDWLGREVTDDATYKNAYLAAATTSMGPSS